jgi:hypothetical protein
LAVRTSSSKRERNVRAGASVLVGLLAIAVVPGAIVAAEVLQRFELLDAGFAIPIAFVLSIAALLLARGARQRVERTLGRVGGRRLAFLGKALGLLALALACSAAIAVASYFALERFAE